MTKIFKSVLAVVLVVCLLSSTPIFAAAPVEGAKPDMTILAGGDVGVYARNGRVYIDVTTKALGSVEKVYHKITVNKNNGINLMYKKEYADYDTMRVSTYLDYAAKEGDIFEVIVEHYAKDGSVVESKTTTTYGSY